ncbi:sporulation and cell division protein SsgA [Nonomuraea polychroma]|uniref:Sporulation and cell division protein SsgA n=1 Tax=Nonomuraea polychroma TaxID=46176 RepID=A0A438M012_9ACTN|nr:SsgA family sporulation/cell division regulator [Nonomuraea polychroma]RVX39130.1 sporulation and cell division protein SsgA [Nonomuraea polychroma]
MKRATSVTQALTLWWADQHEQSQARRGRHRGQGQDPVHAVLAYDARDPYAVELVFPQANGDGGQVVAWQFARALLIDGLQTATGDGDVQVGPHEAEGWLVVVLMPENGVPLTFYASRAVVSKFVDATFDVVQLGRERERVDWDRELAALLGHQVEVTFREADGCWGRTRPGTLAADPKDRDMVVLTVPDSAGTLVSWRVSRDELAHQVHQARRIVRWSSRNIRLAVPGDAELLLGVGVVQEFLLASFHTVMDGAS